MHISCIRSIILILSSSVSMGHYNKKMAHKMFLDDFSCHSDSFAISVQNNLYMYVKLICICLAT